MLRLTLAVTLSLSCVVGPGISSAAQDRPAPGPPPVPDPDWRPKAGDRVMVRPPGSPALPDRATCERYIRSARAGDAAGMREASAAKGAVQLAADTPVLVIEPHGLPRQATGPSSSSPEDVNGDIQDAINRAYTRPKPLVAIEARILDGPHDGKVAFLPMESLAMYVAAPAGGSFAAGDRLVAARPVVMGRDEAYLIQFLGNPDDGSNRAHVLSIPRGSKVTVLAVGPYSVRVKVTTGRHAGRTGHVKADGLEPIPVPAPKPIKK